ncbi:hypothetical protein [Vibrio sp. qd031]|uniref:CAF17-like 4Fe-4S cluster assembly/insertion protein YgfZ n=1 Tax=Vibrio sp. qd031 TaxID=1603038 RepID=UPI000A113628|nr:hypothetical protein [Vibrio sp. qd031]
MTDIYYNQISTSPLTTPCATWLKDWALITVTGPDSKSYLQGQLTCDVVSLEANQFTFGAHCDAKGKVWSLFRIFHIDDGYGLLLPRLGAEKALFELKKYSVFSNLEMVLSESELVGIIADEPVALDKTAELQSVNVDATRTLIIGTEKRLQSLIDEHSLSLVEQGIWQQHDIANGIPRVDENNQNQHIPQAFNLQAIGGISFDKGCYTGQETVARAKYRGTNKRALFIVTGLMDPGATKPLSLERAVGENWRSAGQLIECVVVGETAYATIILANDTATDAQLRLAGTDTLWTLGTLPYTLDEQE